MDNTLSVNAGAASEEVSTKGLTRVILASSVGTMIEWYDFYIFGSLATVIAGKFYQTGTSVGNIIAWLAAFAVGFIVRPFGAIIFGRIGDLIGRKYTFLITMGLMGFCTFAVGLLPTIETIGYAAGVILILLRILQGLALGGEYGGAATYIAEHSPNKRRGFFTSFIQITATAGLLLSLGVILITRQMVGEKAFNDWGWRVPFLISIVLIGISFYIRISLKESPLFAKLKARGATSKNPLKESFANPVNLKFVLLALFGATMGQGVVWYTGQFYALFYLQRIFKLPLLDSNIIVGIALTLASPFFVLMGWLSDRIGRKPIMLGGMLIAAITYIPIYRTMENFKPGPGYDPVMLCLLVFIQVFYVTMVYGPIAAFLVELFPTKIRYTSMSLPYHIGNGVAGGLVPIIGLTLISATHNNYAGLYYPIAVAAICFIVGLIFIKETKDIDINQEYTNR